MEKRYALLFYCLFSFISHSLFSQETNSWTNQIGNVSSLIGGAATARADDNSSIFYNPGALSFVEGPTVSVSADAYFVNFLTIKNGAGQGIDLKSTSLNAAPLLFSGTLKFKKKPDFAINWAVLNKELFVLNTRARYDAQLDVISTTPGDELYTGTYKYLNRTREDWFGMGLSRRFNNKLGIGVSMFVTARSMDFERRINATVFDDEPDTTQNLRVLGLNIFTEDFELRHLGLIFIGGISYQSERISLGASVTTGKIDLPFLKGVLSRTSIFAIESQGVSNSASIFQNKVLTKHKLPWRFDIGGEYHKDKSAISARIGFDLNIDPYNHVKTVESGNPITDALAPSDTAFFNFQSANRSIINLGIGYAYSFREGLGLLAGFRTDFNNHDSENLPRESNFVPSISYWDLYHISAGPVFYGQRFNLTFGLVYTFGQSSGDLQQVNFTNPSDQTFLLGVPDNSTTTSYDQVGVVFGLTYLFDTVGNSE